MIGLDTNIILRYLLQDDENNHVRLTKSSIDS